MIQLSEDTLRFISCHSTEDVRTLALQAGRYPLVDMPAALTQIAGWQVAREKVPTWAETEGIFYPRHLSMEQCSSEQTARYKVEVLRHCCGESVGMRFADLTGGFGIDCAFLAALFPEATYVERQEALCEAARHNFPLLNLSHICVCQADAVEFLKEMPPVDWLFLDPARRDGQGGKTVAIADCEPDVAALEELLLQKAGHVLLKLSPMLDLTQALHTLHHVHEVHVVAVNNECKELLLVLSPKTAPIVADVPVHCVNLTSHASSSLCFTRSQEQEVQPLYAARPGAYLYEPNAAILKAGAFRTLSARYEVQKLHPNSHLYTSDTPVVNFPGRSFRVTACCGLGKKEVKQLLGNLRKANLTVRNFPASVAELRKRLKLQEGGDTYLFATTLSTEEKALLICERL